MYDKTLDGCKVSRRVSHLVIACLGGDIWGRISGRLGGRVGVTFGMAITSLTNGC